MPTRLGRKPVNERIYITATVGCLTAIVLFFLPVFPALNYVIIPGKTTLIQAENTRGLSVVERTIEVQTDARPSEFSARRSLYHSLAYQSEVRRVTLKHPTLSWAIYLLVILAMTGVGWLVVNMIYKWIEQPFAK